MLLCVCDGAVVVFSRGAALVFVFDLNGLRGTGALREMN